MNETAYNKPTKINSMPEHSTRPKTEAEIEERCAAYFTKPKQILKVSTEPINTIPSCQICNSKLHKHPVTEKLICVDPTCQMGWHHRDIERIYNEYISSPRFAKRTNDGPKKEDLGQKHETTSGAANALDREWPPSWTVNVQIGRASCRERV